MPIGAPVPRSEVEAGMNGEEQSVFGVKEVASLILTFATFIGVLFFVSVNLILVPGFARAFVLADVALPVATTFLIETSTFLQRFYVLIIPLLGGPVVLEVFVREKLVNLIVNGCLILFLLAYTCLLIVGLGLPLSSGPLPMR